MWRSRIPGFSALQRAEIAETECRCLRIIVNPVSVLFNEPKLLKLPTDWTRVL